MSLPDWLEDCGPITTENQEHPQERRNVLDFIPKLAAGPTNDRGQSALDLVYQAAELVSTMQEEARQREARTQSLCRTAVERLQLAEKRVAIAEGALSVAESRLSTAEAKLSAAELRARNAEARANELDQALSKIEDAIRTKLLAETQSTFPSRRVAAA